MRMGSKSSMISICVFIAEHSENDDKHTEGGSLPL